LQNCRVKIALLLLILSPTGSAAEQNNGNGDKWGLDNIYIIYIRGESPVKSNRNTGITEIREKYCRAAKGSRPLVCPAFLLKKMERRA
jgi:hypothetical protein